MNKFSVVLILSLLFFLVFSGCLQKETAVVKDEEEISASEASSLLNAAFLDNEIDLGVYVSSEDLANINESSLDAIEKELIELKDSFASQALKDLADVFLSLLAELRTKVELAVQSNVVGDIEELSIAAQCEQMEEFNLLVEKAKFRVNAFTSTNQKMQAFIKNYSSKAAETGFEELVENRLSGTDELFSGFENIQKSVADLKKVCEET